MKKHAKPSFSESRRRTPHKTARPHRSESLEDIAETLRELPGLTYIFIARDRVDRWDVYQFDPDFVSAVALLCDGSRSASLCDRPKAASESKAILRQQSQTKKVVTELVAELSQRKKTTFVLCWRVDRQSDRRTDCSVGYTAERAYVELIDLMQTELSTYVVDRDIEKRATKHH